MTNLNDCNYNNCIMIDILIIVILLLLLITIIVMTMFMILLSLSSLLLMNLILLLLLLLLLLLSLLLLPFPRRKPARSSDPSRSGSPGTSALTPIILIIRTLLLLLLLLLQIVVMTILIVIILGRESPRLAASDRKNRVGKGSRQNRSVTSGKGLAMSHSQLRRTKSFYRDMRGLINLWDKRMTTGRTNQVVCSSPLG